MADSEKAMTTTMNQPDPGHPGLQNYLIGVACNIKRWARRMIWESRANDAINANQWAMA
ncbi:MAG: hypothetical protein J5I99_04155 [Verrucomicrobia bacterium]|nr:hypothetical protein [Kiritimatiellia bacterium]MCO6400405.1 hypothetical protein [Verrucomicrobiota bacterium]